MAEVVSMPKLGFDMAEGVLVRWVVLEGQTVEKGGVLAEIETDKATVEVESTASGSVLSHLVGEGAIVPVNQPIAVIGEEGESVDLDALGISEEAEEETADEGEVEEPADTTEAESDASEPVESSADSRLPDGVRASPLARKIAEDKGIDLQMVNGSGPNGRIVKADVENFQPPTVPEPAADTPTKATGPTLAPAIPAISYEQRPDQQVPLSRLRTAIGRRMVASKQQVPHFYVTHEYNMGALMALRKQINGMLPENEKLSVNDFIVKAAALALRVFPNLNASIDTDAKEIVQYGSVNVGNAVAVENGLLTVVCRDADQKSLRQISLEVKAMAGRAREGKVRPEDIEGSTISISNLGMFGTEEFIAIINPPEAAILAVGSAQQKPVVVDGELTAGWRMKITISVDHRISDGAEAARFMRTLGQYLEEPMRLML